MQNDLGKSGLNGVAMCLIFLIGCLALPGLHAAAASVGSPQVGPQLASISTRGLVDAEIAGLTGIPIGKEVGVTIDAKSKKIVAIVYEGRRYEFVTVNGKLAVTTLYGETILDRDVYRGAKVVLPAGANVQAKSEFTATVQKDGSVKRAVGKIIQLEYQGTLYGLTLVRDRLTVNRIIGYERLQKDIWQGGALKIRAGTDAYTSREIGVDGSAEFKKGAVAVDGCMYSFEEVGDRWVITDRFAPGPDR